MPKNESFSISEVLTDPIIGLGIAYSVNGIEERLVRARKSINYEFKFMWYDAYYASVTFLVQSDMTSKIEEWMMENIPSCHSSGEIWKLSPMGDIKLSHIQFSVKTAEDLELIKKEWIP